MHTATAVRRFGWFLLLVGVPCFGQDAGAVLRRVDEHYNRLRTLRARFVEHYAGMGMDRTESGTLLLAKPGRMRWAYDRPVGKLFVMDGKFGWSYTPGDGQAQRIAAKKLDDLRSPLRFLLGRTRLEKELEGVSVVAADGGWEIAGVPRGMRGRVARLILDVDGAGLIQRLKVEEMDGAATEFSFSEMKENVPVAVGDFVFVVPAGVGVVEGLPPA